MRFPFFLLCIWRKQRSVSKGGLDAEGMEGGSANYQNAMYMRCGLFLLHVVERAYAKATSQELCNKGSARRAISRDRYITRQDPPIHRHALS